MNMNAQDKVRGLFLGTAIGDALGMPVEGFSYEKIKENYGRLDKYVSAKGHKWFDGQPVGAWTDDTQLTLAVAEAFIDAGCLDLDALAKWHVNAYKRHTSGWGPSTREAIARLAAGVHWKDSGNVPRPEEKTEKKPSPRGLGNGVAMKAGPIGAYLAAKEFDWKAVVDRLADFTAMTHRTSIAVSSCLAHTFAVFRCMTSTPEVFSMNTFLASVVNMSEIGRQYFPETLEDDITARFKLLQSVADDPKAWTVDEIVKQFGRGTCYVYNSLPFTYAFFVKDPYSIEGLYDCASAGGDTDSNASMLGGLLGGLNGTSIFPQHLIEGLHNREEVIKIADRFYERVYNDAPSP